MTNQFKTPQLPRIVRTVTHNDRPYTPPKLNPPKFETDLKTSHNPLMGLVVMKVM